MHWLDRCSENEINIVSLDHSYTKPYNWKPEDVTIKPVKKIFSKKQNPVISNRDKQTEEEEEIDVVGFDSKLQVPLLNVAESKHLMNESQRLVNCNKYERDEDWEDNINNPNVTTEEKAIFSKIVQILNEERMARLASANSESELIARRTSLDIATRRFRHILAQCGSGYEATKWIHSFLFNKLPKEYLAIYIDILQTLRHKSPELIDETVRMQMEMDINLKPGSLSWGMLRPFLKKSWDPVASTLKIEKLEKLPKTPYLVIVSVNGNMRSNVSSRQQKWIKLLETLGTVEKVIIDLENEMTELSYMEELFVATRIKIQDLRKRNSKRPIVLVGYRSGAALACQVACLESVVTAVVCLGFPFNTCEGNRGTPEDSITDLKIPLLFIIGENATLVSKDQLEELRRNMEVESELIIVGSADDCLRISSRKKISEGITQTIADRCILRKISNFLGGILERVNSLPIKELVPNHSKNQNTIVNHPLPLRELASNDSTNQNKTVTRKRANLPNFEQCSTDVKKSKLTTKAASTAQSPSKFPVSKVTLSQQDHNNVTGTSLSSILHQNPRSPTIKNNITGRLMTHVKPQQNNHATNSGITLNIGTLASLTPTGPIRLIPTSNSHTATLTSADTSVRQKTIVSYQNTSRKSPMLSQNLSSIKTLKPFNETFNDPILTNDRELANQSEEEAELLEALQPMENDNGATLATTNELPFQFW